MNKLLFFNEDIKLEKAYKKTASGLYASNTDHASVNMCKVFDDTTKLKTNAFIYKEGIEAVVIMKLVDQSTDYEILAVVLKKVDVEEFLITNRTLLPVISKILPLYQSSALPIAFQYEDMAINPDYGLSGQTYSNTNIYSKLPISCRFIAGAVTEGYTITELYAMLTDSYCLPEDMLFSHQYDWFDMESNETEMALFIANNYERTYYVDDSMIDEEITCKLAGIKTTINESIESHCGVIRDVINII